MLNGDSPYPQTGPIGKVLPLPTPVEITARTNGEGSDEDVSSSPVSSLDKRHAHTHTMSTRRVCWHRNTSISMIEHSLSVRVSIVLAAWIHLCIITNHAPRVIFKWPVAQSKRSRVCVEKRQNGGQNSQKALRVLSPLQWWNRLLRGGVPCFLTMNFPFIESRNKCFLYFIPGFGGAINSA